MSAHAAEDLPEELRLSLAEQIAQRPERTQPQALPEDEPPAPEPAAGTGWLLAGMLIVVAVGVLMLLIFASGGNAEQSLML
jgi:cytochrome c-type biogenesis protein CcmH/NrfG